MTFFGNVSMLIFLVIMTIGSAAKMNVIYEWKYIDYVWESSAAKQDAIDSGDYDFKNAAMIDVDQSQDGRTFVTVIRTNGVPASLNIISNENGPGGPLLAPYPNWSWHRRGNCSGITNVYRVAIDKCNRLWVLDNGVIDEMQVCSAQILLFNLETDELVGRTKIINKHSQNSETNQGLLITPVIQTEGKYCERARVFIADVLGHGLITINLPYVWRLEGPYFAPDSKPKSAEVTIAGETFNLTDGLFGMALTPKIGNNPQFLSFRPFASRSLYAATVNDILATNFGKPLYYYSFTDVLPSQTTAQAFSSEATLFFGLTEQIAIGCWNQYKNLVPENIEIVAQDDKTLQFASGVKVIPKSVTGTEEKLLVATNRYQKIARGTMNFSEINFRILTQSVKKLIAGTQCEAPFEIKKQIRYDYNYSL